MNKEQKSMGNKGFSLVELIIVIAIMAVLVGVLAPTYMQYVEKSRKSNDISTVDSIMNACEVLAIDQTVKWQNDATATITVKTTDDITVAGDATKLGDGTKPGDFEYELNKIVPKTTKLKSSDWTEDIKIEATKKESGVVFTVKPDDVKTYSPDLAKRVS